MPQSYSPPWSLLTLRAFRRGVRSFFRDRGWLPSLLALTGMAFLFQMILLGSEGGFAMQSLLKDSPAFRIPLLSTADDQAAQNFFSSLRTQSFVRDAQFETKDQILEQERKNDSTLATFLDRYNLRNPFPDTVTLHLQSVDALPAFTAFLQSVQWRDTIDPAFLSQVAKAQSQTGDTIAVARAAGSVAWIVLILTTIAMLAAVAAFLRARSLLRSDEILVLRLLGERPLFLLLPFATEALALLVYAFALAAILLLSLILLVPLFVPAFSPEGVLGPLQSTTLALLLSNMGFLLGITALLLLLLAALGAYFGVSRSPLRVSLLSLFHASH